MHSLRGNFVKQNFIQFLAQPKLSDTTAPSRLGHPHHQVFTITPRNTAFGVGLLCTSAQHTDNTTVLTTERYPFLQQDFNPYPCKGMAIDPCFGQHGHWNWLKTK